MAIKELGYVIIETALAAQWHDFLTNVAGVMAGEDKGDGARHYRIDDRPFRFRIEEAAEERLAAAAYEIDTRDVWFLFHLGGGNIQYDTCINIAFNADRFMLPRVL